MVSFIKTDGFKDRCVPEYKTRVQQSAGVLFPVDFLKAGNVWFMITWPGETSEKHCSIQLS